MSNALTQLPSAFNGALPTAFQSAVFEDDLAAGVTGGFGVLSYRGKVWRTKFRGEETAMTMVIDGQQVPRHSIEVVVVRAAPVIAKNYYEGGYVEGSSAPPDCFSTNGQTPDPSSPKPQHATCAACPRNQFGSKITEAGKKGKECGDSKRLAVVPLGDIDNEVLGGPMLLRVPAASLGDMANFSKQMRQLGYPYNAFGMRIAFDMKEAYPKFVFSAIRPLTEDEAAKVVALYDDPRVDRILNSSEEAPAATEQAPPQNAVAPKAVAPQAAQQATQAAPAATQAPKAVAAKPAPAKRAPAPAQAPVQAAPVQEDTSAGSEGDVAEDDGSTGTGFDAELDDALAALNI